MKKIVLAFVLVCTLQAAKAHAIWLESNPTATVGTAHEARLFFGEYGGNERDTVAKWFSNLNESEIWLVAPDGKKSKLEGKKELEYISASFTPAKEGVYTVLVFIVVRDMHGSAKIEYSASAKVQAGAEAKGNTIAANSNPVAIYRKTVAPAAANQPIAITALLNGKPAVKETVMVAVPGTEGEKFTTDEKGEFTFTPKAAGRYMVEVMHNDKTPGTHNGKEYKSIWKIATEIVEVK